MFRRQSYLLGVLCGVIAGALATTALAVGGLIDTAALYPPKGREVVVWDTHGSARPDDWTRITGSTHRFSSARHIHVMTEVLRLDWVGGNGPGLYRMRTRGQPTNNRASLPLTPAPGGPAAGPGTVSLPSNQEARISMELPGLRATFVVRTRNHGYRVRLESSRPPSSRFARGVALSTFVAPFIVTDGASVRAASPMRGHEVAVPLRPGRGYALRLEGQGHEPFVMARTPALLDIRSDGAGFVHEARVLPTPGASTLDFYVGQMSSAIRPSATLSNRPPRRRVTVAQRGTYLEMSMVRGRWALTTRSLSAGGKAMVPREASTFGLMPAAGTSSSFDRLNSEGLSSLASPIG